MLLYQMSAKQACATAREILYSGMGRYNNTYPYNCAYNGSDSGDPYISGDCWNMFPKCLYWGDALGTPIDKWRYHGAYINPAAGRSKTGLPDITGGAIMSGYCTDVSADFHDLVPGELLYITDRHMGLYVGELGEWTWYGKTYNVIEFTSDSVLGTGCLASYVDEQGRRYSVDRVRSGSWSSHGKFDGFTYEPALTYELPPLDHFLRAVGNYKLMLPVYKDNDQYYWINIWIQYVLASKGFYSGAIDGIFGQMTFNALKSLQSSLGVTVDGIFGSETLAAIIEQYYL